MYAAIKSVFINAIYIDTDNENDACLNEVQYTRAGRPRGRSISTFFAVATDQDGHKSRATNGAL